MQVLQVQEYNSYAINKYGYNSIHLFLNYRNNELRRTGYVAYNDRVQVLRYSKKQAIKDFTKTIEKYYGGKI